MPTRTYLETREGQSENKDGNTHEKDVPEIYNMTGCVPLFTVRHASFTGKTCPSPGPQSMPPDSLEHGVVVEDDGHHTQIP